jgi:hypothetical protein
VSIRVLHRVARRHSPAHPHRQLLGDPARRFADPPEENPVATIARPSATLPSATGGASSQLHQASVLLENAAILSAPTSIIQLAAAPAASYLLLPTYGIASFQWVDQFYSGFDGAAYFAIVSDGGSTLLTTALEAADGAVQGLLNYSDSRLIAFSPREKVDSTYGVIAQAFIAADFAGSGLRFVFANGGDNITGGDARNRLSVAVEFRVLDLATGRLLTTDESGWDGSVFA